MSKPVLVSRSAREESKEEPGKGVPWEDFVGMEVRNRKEPWRQLDENLGTSYARSQSYNESVSSPVNVAPPVVVTPTTIPAHTHPLSDIVVTYLALTVVTAVYDDGTNLVYKTRQVTLPVLSSGDESAWTTFAQTVTECP